MQLFTHVAMYVIYVRMYVLHMYIYVHSWSFKSGIDWTIAAWTVYTICMDLYLATHFVYS